MKSALFYYANIFLTLGLFAGHYLVAQDLSAFKVIDYQSVGLAPAGFAKRGGCLVDIDRNGWPDIYTLKYNGPGYSRLYTNNGGFFTDITDQTPLQQIEGREGIRTFNVVWADYDNDGDKDCSFGTNKAIYLLRNDNNILTDVSAQTGFVGHQPPGFITEWHYNVCAWADYDLDGDLDCLVYQYNNANMYLFRNDEGIFTDVATEAGLDSTILSKDSFINPIVFIDWDMDGDPDICGRHEFFANENGVFRDVTTEIGLDGVSWTNHKEFLDYDNDGDLDYFKETGKPDDGYNELWENRDGYYIDVSQEVGIILMRDRYRGTSAGDFDNDGDQDIFIQQNIPESPEVLLVNDEIEPGVRAFADVTEFVGLSVIGDRIGCGFFDYDKDGFLDLYIHSADHSHILYHNLANNGANWIGFILEGTLSNRDAVGSFIWLYYADGKQQLRYTNSGGDYLRQDNPWVHFGLGFEASVDSVVIRWPLGYRQKLVNPEIGQYHEIKEPDYTSVEKKEISAAKAPCFLLEQNYPNPFNPDTQIKYHISNAGQISLAVYDIAGREVVTLVNGRKDAGSYIEHWDGHDGIGRLVPSGIYIYQMKTGNSFESRKMVFIQ